MDTALSEKIDAFFGQFKKQLYKKGEILVRADDDPAGIFYLKSGMVKEYAISKKGEEVVVNIFKPHAFFPMSWAVNDMPNGYYFEAVSDTDVIRAPRERVLEFVKQNPDVLYNLLQRVYKGTDGLLTRMVYLMGGSAYDRLITEIIIQAKRFGETNKTSVSLKVSETDLAAQTGMTRETVSREMKTLKNKGLVVLQRNSLVITSLQKLEDELVEV